MNFVRLGAASETEEDPFRLLTIAFYRYRANPSRTWRRHPRAMTGLLAGAVLTLYFTLFGVITTVSTVLCWLSEPEVVRLTPGERQLQTQVDDLRQDLEKLKRMLAAAKPDLSPDGPAPRD
jgi:hypothetical protein